VFVLAFVFSCLLGFEVVLVMQQDAGQQEPEHQFQQVKCCIVVLCVSDQLDL